jgi:hypothetical protein
MATSSNIYAEKIFAEHPLDLWVLDDKADYVSLITESQRQVSGSNGWTLENCSTTTNDLLSDSPFPDSYTRKIQGDALTDSTYTISVTSPNIANFSDLNQSFGTVTVSTYIYSNISDVAFTSFSIGIKYGSTTIEKTFTTPLRQQWILLAETFDIPSSNDDFKVVIKANVKGDSPNINSYDFYINGITVGQWSAEFNATSLGVTAEPIPSTISLPIQFDGITADSYGLSQNYGYYLIKNSSLLAKNTSIPMVFGGSNVTVIYPNTEVIEDEEVSLPSFIVPGKGFLNELGQNSEYTVEFWLRVNSDSYIPKKIFGPIASDDGLYVEGGFLTLSINGESQSHFVNEWYRPMLVHIRVVRNSASMLINGEEVFSFAINTNSLVLPSALGIDGNSQDWLGFYSYEDVFPLEISCFAIYSYQVPSIVAKRRFVYGQAVGSPENINNAFGGTTAFIDYPFSNYSVNYNYPDFTTWTQGSFDNLSVSNKFLSTPDYSLPEIYLNDKTLTELYDDNQSIQDEDYKFITFRPNSGWDSTQAYFNFPKFNLLSDQVHTFYGVFKPATYVEDEILIKFYNRITGNSLTIKVDQHDVNNDEIDEDVISYYLVYNGQIENDFLFYEYTPGEKVAVGIDIAKFSQYYGGNIAAFFGNQNGMEVYVGGDKSGLETFTGKIYDIGFCSARNALDIADHFEENGLAIIEDATYLIDHLASYTLLVGENYGRYNLDIGIAGYWQDYLPLSYFAKYIKDVDGESVYDLDFLQFNIGYPSISSVTGTSTFPGWTYSELSSEYAGPPVRSYSDLASIAFTGFNNYLDLERNTETVFDYNTENSSVRSYVTFQYIEDGANLINSNFSNIVGAEQNKLIDVSEYENWEVTKFEVVDNTIIYPRKDVDFNDLAIVYTLEFNVRGIINKKVNIDRLQLASQVFNGNSSNPIGTRFGINMYPYTKSGIYYNYKGKNPFSIYKGSTPYLYLTRSSGIEVRGEDTSKDRGISMTMNEQRASDYTVNAFQVWMRYDKTSFPEGITKLFELEDKEKKISFYVTPVDELKQRGEIFAIVEGGSEEYVNLSYYINGKPVAIPTVTSKEWVALGISFLDPLDLNNASGKINLTGPFVYNNISYYKTNNLANIQTIITRSWASVKDVDGDSTPNDWQYWTDTDWFGVLAVDTFETGTFDPGKIYNAYIGVNKIVFDDSEGLSIQSNSLTSYSDITWSRRSETAV